MITLLKEKYMVLLIFYKKIKFYYSINWTKTLYFNFRKFPFSVAKRFPVYFYGKVKFTSIKGVIKIEAPLKSGMIGFGQSYETNTIHKGFAEINIEGTIVFKGHVQFGKDYIIKIGNNAYCEMGHLSSLGSCGKLICMNHVALGTYARIGFESQIMDTNFHKMFDTVTGKEFSKTAPIIIGNYNYIGNRVSIMQNTITPDYCTVASNSLCNKDYSNFEKNTLIGGIPAKLIKSNISRDWAGEEVDLKRYLIV